MTPKIGVVAVPLLILLLVGIGSPISTAVAQQRREPAIGWLDLQRVLQQTPGYAAAESTFNREMQPLQRDIEALRKRVDSVITAFAKESGGLSPAARETRRNEIQQLSADLEQRSNEVQERAQSRQRELMSPLEARARSVVQGIRAERSLALIIDVSVPGPFVAMDPALDLTKAVLQRLRTAP
jgi:outer membrane protein